MAFDDARGDTHKTYTGQTAPDDAGDIVSVSFTLQRGDLIVRVQFAAAPTAQHDYYASGVYSRTDCWLELALDPDGSMPGYWTVCGGERSAFVAAGTVRIDGTALEITVPAGELPFTARPGDRLESLNATSHLRAAYVPTVPAPTSNRADIAMTGVPLRLA